MGGCFALLFRIFDERVSCHVVCCCSCCTLFVVLAVAMLCCLGLLELTLFCTSCSLRIIRVQILMCFWPAAKGALFGEQRLLRQSFLMVTLAMHSGLPGLRFTLVVLITVWFDVFVSNIA